MKDSTLQFLVNGLRVHQAGETVPPTTIPAEVRQFCALDETGQTLMKTAMNQLQLSARAYHRILKLAHSIHSTMSQIWRGVRISGKDTCRRRCSIGRG